MRLPKRRFFVFIVMFVVLACVTPIYKIVTLAASPGLSSPSVSGYNPTYFTSRYTHGTETQVSSIGFQYSEQSSFSSVTTVMATSPGGLSTDFSASANLSRGTTYYVRAFANIELNGSPAMVFSGTVTYYGTGEYLTPTVETEAIEFVDDYAARVLINVTDSGGSSISSRGVVFSVYGSAPSLEDNNSFYISAGGSTGSTSVTLSSLRYDTRYYVRAYATNSYGTSYGRTLNFVTGEYWDGYSSSSVKTTEITDITADSARAYGNIYSASGYTILERGFAYSSQNKRPTTSDYKVYDSVNATGSYNLKLTGLSAGTTYYLRSYYRTSAGTYYGDAVTFTTLSAKTVTTTFNFKTLAGDTVGSQSIKASPDTVLNAEDLLLPTGYSLYTVGWSYTVKNGNTVSVPVVPNAGTESSFMPNAGNFQFKPDAPITRREVAEAIYRLSGGTSSGTPRVFGDVGYSSQAIDYVSGMGYMIGYPGGTFKPGSSITRAEMAVVLCNVYRLQGYESCDFSDVRPGYWGYNYIALATKAGMISGYPDSTYKPGSFVTRAEACSLFSRAEGRTLKPIGNMDFTDVPPSHWAYRYIMNAATPLP